MANSSTTMFADTADEVRSFLSSVRPIPGCCFDKDERFHAGRAAIERIANAYDKEQEPTLTLIDCANIASYLSSITAAADAECPCCSGESAASGHDRVLEVVSETIKQAAGTATEHNRAIADAEMELLKARSVLDVLHDLYAGGDDAVKESVTDAMPGTLYCILEHVRRAEERLSNRNVEI